MPVYLCQSGSGTDDPWRHGLKVFAEPFPMTEQSAKGRVAGTARDLVCADWKPFGEEPGVPVATVGSQPIRKLRHSEVVIADDICIAYDRYWLRLRWPGSKGGFAGYVAMGLVSEVNKAKGMYCQKRIRRLHCLPQNSHVL